MDERTPPEFDELSEDLRARIKPELAPDERLCWAGRSGLRVPTAGSSGVTFALFAGGFGVISVVCLAAFAGAFGPRWLRIEMLLAGVGLVAGIIALLMVLGMIGSVVDARAERRRFRGELYALTDRRAIIWRPQPRSSGVEVFSFPRGTVKTVHRLEYPDGSGDVSFGRPEATAWNDPTAFFGVPEARRVEELVRRLLIEPEAPIS